MNYSVGPGWIPLVETAIKEINMVDPNIKIDQIKEKFGILTIYLDQYNNQIINIIHKYETMSGYVCECCGKPGQLRKTGWIKTLCDEHYNLVQTKGMFEMRRLINEQEAKEE